MASNTSSTVNQSSPFGDKNISACTEPIEIPIQGEIPAWVHGVLYRVGLGTFNIRKNDGSLFHFHHPFDGLAMLHRFEIHGGENARVIYTSRHTATGVESRILQDDSTLVFFGPDPCKTIFGRIQSVFHQIRDHGQGVIERRMQTDAEGENINVAIAPNFPLPDDLEKEWGIDAGMALVVKTDANMIQLVDNVTLKPKKIFTYKTVDPAYGARFSAAHHQDDPETGEWVNFTLEIFPKPTWNVFSYAKSKTTGSVDVKRYQPICENLCLPINRFFSSQSLAASYTHAFAMTKNYIIIPNWSYYFTYRALSILWYGNGYESLYFDPNLPTLFHVLNRHSGLHVATYESDPAFAFHTANAWDENGTIWMDIATYPDSRIVDESFDFARMYKEGQVKPIVYVKTQEKNAKSEPVVSEVRRYKLSNVPDQPSHEHRRAEYQVIGLDLDLPRFDPRRKHQSYRYLYGTCRSKQMSTHKGSAGVILNGVQKMDLGPSPSLTNPATSTSNNDAPKGPIPNSEPNTLRFNPPATSCSEPIFIPNPLGTDEDDGVVLTMINEVRDDEKETCALMILNARDFSIMARAEIGPWHTKTVHGSFVDENGRAITVS